MNGSSRFKIVIPLASVMALVAVSAQAEDHPPGHPPDIPREGRPWSTRAGRESRRAGQMRALRGVP